MWRAGGGGESSLRDEIDIIFEGGELTFTRGNRLHEQIARQQPSNTAELLRPTCLATQHELSDQDILRLAHDQDDARWTALVLERTLDERVVRCPLPNCFNVFVVALDHQGAVTCPACTRDVCPTCGVRYHYDVDCDVFQARLEQATRADPETQAEITQNTQPCPRCQNPIHHNGGCDHMTCECVMMAR